MARLLAAKAATGLVMIWVVASAMFFLVLDMPGNPAKAREAQDILHGMTPAQAQRETAAMFGFVPKQPLADQYGHYSGNCSTSTWACRSRRRARPSRTSSPPRSRGS